MNTASETKGLGYGYERHLHRQLLPHRSGSFGGGLKDASAVEMCAAVVKEAIYRASAAPEQVDEVIFGGVLTAGLGQNVARQGDGQGRRSLPWISKRCAIRLAISGSKAFYSGAVERIFK